MRALPIAHALLLAATLCPATPAHAGEPAEAVAAAAHAPPTGGLSLVPERWRYRAAPAAAIAAAESRTLDLPRAPDDANESLKSLEVGYVSDRGSLVNTIRARRGLPLLTLWERAGRCLFFGINDRGRAGFSLVRMRTLERSRSTGNGIARLYAELTGERRATFPEPPALIAHRVR